MTFPGKQIYETLSRKSSIPQTLSAEWQKSQTVSGKFKPMLSWSHYFELLKVEEPLEGTAISQYANIP